MIRSGTSESGFKQPLRFRWLAIGYLLLSLGFMLVEHVAGAPLVLVPVAIHMWTMFLSLVALGIAAILGDGRYSILGLRVQCRLSRHVFGAATWVWWLASVCTLMMLAPASIEISRRSPGLLTSLLIGIAAATHLGVTFLVVFSCWRAFVPSGKDLAEILSKEGLCPQCRYPGGHLNTCPECGYTAAPIIIKSPQP